MPIMRLRKTKRTVGVSQLFMEVHIHSMELDSSNMAPISEREREKGLLVVYSSLKRSEGEGFTASASGSLLLL